MDIASLSTSMAMQKLQYAISTSVIKKAMDQQEISSQALIEGISKANPVKPSCTFGQKFDIRI